MPRTGVCGALSDWVERKSRRLFDRMSSRQVISNMRVVRIWLRAGEAGSYFTNRTEPVSLTSYPPSSARCRRAPRPRAFGGRDKTTRRGRLCRVADNERSAVAVLDSLLVQHQAPISFPGQNESIALPNLSRIVTHFAAKGRVGGGATPGFSCPVICDFASRLLSFSQLSRLHLRLRIFLPTSSAPLPRKPLRPLPRNRSACRGPASRRRPASAGSIVWTATANAGSKPLRGSRL